MYLEEPVNIRDADMDSCGQLFHAEGVMAALGNDLQSIIDDTAFGTQRREKRSGARSRCGAGAQEFDQEDIQKGDQIVVVEGSICRSLLQKASEKCLGIGIVWLGRLQ